MNEILNLPLMAGMGKHPPPASPARLDDATGAPLPFEDLLGKMREQGAGGIECDPELAGCLMAALTMSLPADLAAEYGLDGLEVSADGQVTIAGQVSTGAGVLEMQADVQTSQDAVSSWVPMPARGAFSAMPMPNDGTVPLTPQGPGLQSPVDRNPSGLNLDTATGVEPVPTPQTPAGITAPAPQGEAAAPLVADETLVARETGPAAAEAPEMAQPVNNPVAQSSTRASGSVQTVSNPAAESISQQASKDKSGTAPVGKAYAAGEDVSITPEAETEPVAAPVGAVDSASQTFRLAGAEHPKEAQPLQMVNQIADTLQEMGKLGRTELRMQLQPENLGKIELQVMRNTQGLRIQVTADQMTTGALIENHVADLEKALLSAGVNLAGISVGYGAPDERRSRSWTGGKQYSGNGPSHKGQPVQAPVETLRRSLTTSNIDFSV